MMSRLQIMLDPEQHRAARKKAAQLGISFAEYVRRLVARDLSAPEPTADPDMVFDLGSSAGADIARFKDDMLAAAMVAERASEVTNTE